MRHEKPLADPKLQSILELDLKDGDVLTMEALTEAIGGHRRCQGLCQKHCVHFVPCEQSRTGARINVTWRWIRSHKLRCPGP